jgi:hypothetical protein
VNQNTTTETQRLSDVLAEEKTTPKKRENSLSTDLYVSMTNVTKPPKLPTLFLQIREEWRPKTTLTIPVK